MEEAWIRARMIAGMLREFGYGMVAGLTTRMELGMEAGLVAAGGACKERILKQKLGWWPKLSCDK